MEPQRRSQRPNGLMEVIKKENLVILTKILENSSKLSREKVTTRINTYRSVVGPDESSALDPSLKFNFGGKSIPLPPSVPILRQRHIVEAPFEGLTSPFRLVRSLSRTQYVFLDGNP